MTDAPRPPRLGRKSLIQLLLVYAALVGTVCGVSALKRRGADPDALARELAAARPPPGELRRFLGPIAADHDLGGATITQIGPLRSGGLQVSVRPAGGEPIALEVRRRAPDAPRPLAETARLAIYLLDLSARGPADATTPPAALQAAEQLAAALAVREAEVEPPAVLTPLGTP